MTDTANRWPSKTITLDTGTYSWGTMRMVDLIPVAMAVAQQIDPQEAERIRAGAPEVFEALDGATDISNWDLAELPQGDYLTDIYIELCDIINYALPEWLYWGSTEGDGTAVGIWMADLEDIIISDDPETQAAALAWLGLTLEEYQADPCFEMPATIDIEVPDMSAGNAA